MKLLFLFALLISVKGFSQDRAFNFRNGDLLFQDLDCGPLCDAIEAVTEGAEGMDFSHLGMIFINDRQEVMVIEAIGTSVQLTPLVSFLNRSMDLDGQPKVVVATVSDTLRPVAEKAVLLALKHLGEPYDNAFLPGNDKWYCSELIAASFNAAAGRVLFPNAPMTFKDPVGKQFYPVWVEYYSELQMRIPEGVPGCNPGAMSTAAFLSIRKPYSSFSR